MANEFMFFDEDVSDIDLEAAIAQEIGKADQEKLQENTKDQSPPEVASDKEELENFFRNQDEFLGEQDEDDDEPVEQDAVDPEDEDEDVDSDEEGEEDENEDTDEDDLEDDEVEVFNSSDILQMLREESLLDIPDDFEGDLTEETLEDLKRRTFTNRDRQIIESRRALYANDPEKLAWFDYFMTAGPDADLPRFQSTVENIKQYENLDIKDEDAQRQIISEYLKEGLDPNIPAHKLRLSRIDKEVDEILNNYEGETQAREAKEYFIDKYGKEMQSQLEKAQQLEQQRLEYEAAMREQELRWHQNFRETLEKRSWSDNRKEAIMEEQYGEVMLQDGTTAPVWYVKEQIIKNNPDFYQRYLDWLNTSFDLDSMKFKEDVETEESKVTRKILSLVSKKSSGRKSKSTSRKGKKSRRAENQVVDPRDAL